MTPDLLDRMRTADPAAGADLTPPEELLSRLLSEFPDAPAPRVRRRARRRLALGLTAAALAVGAFVAVAVVDGPGPDLAAKAYAQTSDAGSVLYVRAHVESDLDAEKPDGSPLTDQHAATTESWLHGDRARLYADFGKAGWSDSELRADGSIRFRNGYGQDIVLHDGDGPDAAEQRKQLSQNFVAEFRREYQQGTLDAAGTTTFAGKRAQRYVVDTSGVAPGAERVHSSPITWTERHEFFVDAANGTPLGSIRTSTSVMDGRTSVARTTEIVEAIEHLPPTPENLAQLELRR
ncbi:MAG TPA: hypothetical protein VI300_07135 [Solirubrobacter sp.]